MVQKSIFRDRTLPSAVKLVYTCLATYANEERVAWPSQDTIAEDTSLSIRTVKRAIRTGEDVGLFDVIHTQGSNRYRLRDFKVGGYVPGSGPECHSGTSEVPDSHSGSAPVAHEQDQPTRPESQTRTSSDAFAASGHRASAPTDNDDHQIRIFLPRNFKRMDDGAAMQHLVAASISALRAVGMTPADDAADRIGRGLRIAIDEDGMDRDKLVSVLRTTLGLAGTDNATWGNLASWRHAG